MAQLKTPQDIKALLASRFERQRDAWLLGGGDWPLRVPLGSVTEADVQNDLDGVLAWVRSWSDWPTDPDTPVTLERVERSWPRIGRQTLPSYIVVASPLKLSRFVGSELHWVTTNRRAEILGESFPPLRGHRVLGRYFEALATFKDDDFDRLVGLLGWVRSNPSSNLYLRQLPVEGLDTKWIGSRKAMVRDFVLALRGEEADGERDLEALLGLRRQEHRIRLRVLCPLLRSQAGNVGDLESPLSDVAKMPIRPSRILIVENQETALALPDIADTVVFFKLGLAVGSLRHVPWVVMAKRLVYWGDIDTHGYLILDRARRILPGIVSVLMDEPTLRQGRHLCVHEPSQAKLPEDALLHPHEREVADGLASGTWGEQLRLEQERLYWTSALAVVTRALDAIAE